MKIGRWLGVAGMAWLVGCGGGGAPKAPPSTPVDVAPGYAAGVAPSSMGEGGYPSQPSSAPASAPPAEAPSRSAAPEPSPPATASRDEAVEKSPSQRPGLGTEWGETRTSRVHDVAFDRADPDRPFAIATLRYDDRKGVDALATLHARTTTWWEVPVAKNGAITVSVRDASGRPLEARHVGDRTYVIGRAGDRYSIVLANHTRHRVEAVATVDGLDVINGHAGSLDNRGYLLEPRSSLAIDGFRQSEDAVAAFRFGRVADSYAAQTGSARDVGVIGVAFFDEAGDRFDDDGRDDEARLRDSATPFPADDRFARPPR